MVPSVACAISVSSALPEAWLNNQAYQKVTAMVASASIGLDPNWGMKNKRGMPDGDADRHQHGGGQVGSGWSAASGWAQPRKLASSGSWALKG